MKVSRCALIVIRMEFMNDEELGAALKKHEDLRNIPVNSSTRHVLLRKLVQLSSKKSQGDVLPASPQSPVDDNFQNERGQSSPVGDNACYAVALGDVTHWSNIEKLEQTKQVYQSQSDAFQAIRHIPGARCIRHDTEENAREFIRRQHQRMRETVDKVQAVPTAADKPAGEEKVNCYPSLTSQDLNRLRTIIEKGNVDSFCRTVWNNPRHLITVGDTPEILKPGVRYNALHCAVRSGSLAICKELVEILEGDLYWSKIYPEDPLEVRKRRRDHLMDLYLNTCDRGVML